MLKQGEREKGSNTFASDGIANLLSEFIYKLAEGITFPTYFKRYERIFAKRCQSWSDEEKIMLVQQKLSTHENTKYMNYILPNKPEEMSFEETIETLSKMFGEWDSLFHSRYKCLYIIKEDDEDFVAYARKINAQCERFKLKDLKEDMFKCLIFVQGLTSNKDKVIQSKILTILEQDAEITLQKVSEECQKLINIRWDNICIEEKNIDRINKVSDNKERKESKPHERRVKEHYERKIYCKARGSSNHTTSRCYFRNKICLECAQMGHKASMCRKRNYQKPKMINAVLSKVMKNNRNRKYVDMKING